MDPLSVLSVASSVAGLLTAAKEISSAISKIKASHKNGGREILEIKRTVDNLRTVFTQLQLLLLQQAAIDPDRASMLLVEEIVSTLTACVMTFSDLHGCINGLKGEDSLGLVNSIRWAARSSELKGCLQNLESHKTSLTLMLTILTWYVIRAISPVMSTNPNLSQSADSAGAAAAEVKILVASVLESNKFLARRMSLLERNLLPTSLSDGYRDSASVFSSGTARAQRYSTVQLNGDEESHTQQPFTFQFEPDLNSSWVYRRNQARGSNTFTITSSTRMSKTWSLLSGISLSQISNIAIQALPIHKGDLLNSEYYIFEAIKPQDHVLQYRSLSKRGDLASPDAHVVQYPKLIIQNDGRKTYALRKVEEESSKEMEEAMVQQPTLDDYLDVRKEPKRPKPKLKLDTSCIPTAPWPPSSVIHGQTSKVQHSRSNSKPDTPILRPVATQSSSEDDRPKLRLEVQKSQRAEFHPMGDLTLALLPENGHMVYSSATGIDDESDGAQIAADSSASKPSKGGVSQIFWLAKSVSKYRPQESRSEAGFPYLTYERYQVSKPAITCNKIAD